MRRWLGLGGSVAVLAVSGCVKRNPSPVPANPFQRGERVALVLPRWPNGAPHDLSEDLGQVVLLDVWATWCEPCRDALPVYEKFQQTYGPRGLRVYAINMDEDTRQIAPFLKDVKVSLPILLEQDSRVEQSLGVRLMPTTFLLDRKGQLRHRHEGFSEDMVTKSQSELEALLAEP